MLVGNQSLESLDRTHTVTPMRTSSPSRSFACALTLAALAAVVLAACGADKDPAGFDCDCEATEICRDGRCIPRSELDLGGDGPADAGADFVDNPDCPASGIVINEVLYTPASPDPEFVELLGPAGRSLEGFVLEGINGNGGNPFFEVTLEGSLDANGFFVVSGAALAGADMLAEDLEMQNGPDSLVLRDCGGARVDALGYGGFSEADVFAGEGTPAPGTGSGEALGRCAGDDPDTDDNGADFHVITAPTPGGANDGFEDPFACTACVGGTFTGQVVINEVLYDPDGADSVDTEFVELVGPDGLDLFGLTVEWINGSDGEPYMSLALDLVIGESGIVTIGGPDPDVALPGTIQNGPDAVRLVDCSGAVVDALAYGEGIEDLGEGSAAAEAGSGLSLGRCATAFDTDDNGDDFAEATPSPGAENDDFVDAEFCGGGGGSECDRDLRGVVVINELLVDEPGSESSAELAFVELRGAPGTVLDGARIELVNGSSIPSADPNAIYQTHRLSGTIPENGLFVIGEAGVPNVDLVVALDLQNGPDSVRLVDCLDNRADAVAYGNFSETNYYVGEPADPPSPAPAPREGESLARCPGPLAEADTDDNAADFRVVPAEEGEEGANAGLPNPACDGGGGGDEGADMGADVDEDSGESDLGGGGDDTGFGLDFGFGGDLPLDEGGSGCTGLAGQLLINEFLPDEPGSDSEARLSFVELRGTPGASLEGVLLQLVNGASIPASDATAIYSNFALDGTVPSDGLYVVGETGVPNVDRAVTMDMQNGPDNIRLVDCTGATIDAVAYGTFGETNYYVGEPATPRSPAATNSSSHSIGRCAGALDAVDTNDNATDFRAIPVAPGSEGSNAGVENPGC
jgi:hypothetical protein